MCLLPLSNINLLERCGLFLDSLFCSTGVYVFLCQPHVDLITMALYYSLILGSVIPPTLLFFLRIAVAMWGLLWFHINF